MPILLYPLGWALGKLGLGLTLTGGSGAVLGSGAVAAWSVTTAKGVILMSATTAYKVFTWGGLTALATSVAPFIGSG